MMSTATETKLDVEISITETAPCTKRIALSVPASAIDQRLEFALSAFLRDASIPGFRKGKAPRASKVRSRILIECSARLS